MKKLIIHPTDMASWLTLVAEAQHSSSIQLHEELESYLVFLLMRFMNRPEMASSVLGLDFLKSANSAGQARHHQLRDVGDQCLLVSGLFPGRAEKKQVRLSYFVQLGRSAYSTISSDSEHDSSDLFGELSNKFIHLRDVLFAIRALAPDEHSMNFWQALDLWEKNQSQTAKKILDEMSPTIIHPESTKKQ